MSPLRRLVGTGIAHVSLRSTDFARHTRAIVLLCLPGSTTSTKQQHGQNDQANEADATAAIAEMGRAHSLSNRQRMKARRALGRPQV
jgi:hypothetical protein